MTEPVDVTEFARQARQFVEQVATGGQPVVVGQAGERAAVLISAAEFATLQRLKSHRQARFRRDLATIHRAAEEAALVNSFSEDEARDAAKQAQQTGRRRVLETPPLAHGATPGLPHFCGGGSLGSGDVPMAAGVPRTMLDAHQLLTYLVGSGQEVRPLLDAWGAGQLDVLVPRFLLLDLHGGLEALAEQGRIDPEAGECLLELLAREGEPVADPVLPPGFLPGPRGRLN